MLLKCIISSGGSVIISQTLYEQTGDDKYLDIIKKNIDKDVNEISYVAMLSYCKPCKKSYDLLVDIYCNSDNKTIRSTAVTGILFNKGFITDPLNLQEMVASVELGRKFIADDVNERRMIIKMLETGQMEKYRK